MFNDIKQAAILIKVAALEQSASKMFCKHQCNVHSLLSECHMLEVVVFQNLELSNVLDKQLGSICIICFFIMKENKNFDKI